MSFISNKFRISFFFKLPMFFSYQFVSSHKSFNLNSLFHGCNDNFRERYLICRYFAQQSKSYQGFLAFLFLLFLLEGGLIPKAALCNVSEYSENKI